MYMKKFVDKKFGWFSSSSLELYVNMTSHIIQSHVAEGNSVVQKITKVTPETLFQVFHFIYTLFRLNSKLTTWKKDDWTKMYGFIIPASNSSSVQSSELKEVTPPRNKVSYL